VGLFYSSRAHTGRLYGNNGRQSVRPPTVLHTRLTSRHRVWMNELWQNGPGLAHGGLRVLCVRYMTRVLAGMVGDAKWNPPDGAALFTADEATGEDDTRNGEVGSASREYCHTHRAGEQNRRQEGDVNSCTFLLYALNM